MAVEEYVVVCPESSGQVGETERKWSGAAAGSFLKDSNLKNGAVAIVNAESVGEALKGAKHLNTTLYADKMLAIKKSSMTEE